MRCAWFGVLRCSSVTLACTSPTFTGCPSRVHSARLARALPHIAVDATSITPTATAKILWREDAGIAHVAAAALTLATSADTPYTPITLASWAIGSTVAWLYPRSTQGN